MGTHVPDDRDNFQSALQRMREAFDGLRTGSMTVGSAEDEFLIGYDTVRDYGSQFFLARRMNRNPDRP